jgi:hypothetical protein
MAVIHSLSPGFEDQVLGVSPAAGQKNGRFNHQENRAILT